MHLRTTWLQISLDSAKRRHHGEFLPWIEAESEMSERSAYRFISVAEKFGNNSASLAGMGREALYELASSTVDVAGVVKDRLAAVGSIEYDTDGTEGLLSTMLEQWRENLECPRCKARGIAELSQAEHERLPTVVSVEGFTVTSTPSGGPVFYCATCDVPAKP